MPTTVCENDLSGSEYSRITFLPFPTFPFPSFLSLLLFHHSLHIPFCSFSKQHIHSFITHSTTYKHYTLPFLLWGMAFSLRNSSQIPMYSFEKNGRPQSLTSLDAYNTYNYDHSSHLQLDDDAFQHEKGVQEKALVRRLDLFILPLICIIDFLQVLLSARDTTCVSSLITWYFFFL